MTEQTATNATLPIALVLAGLVGACGTVGGFPGHIGQVGPGVVEQATIPPRNEAVRYCDQTGRVVLAGDHPLLEAMRGDRDRNGHAAIRPCPREMAAGGR